MSTAALLDQILALQPDERAILAQRVWDSIEHFISPEIEQAWLTEAENRWNEIEAGKIKCIPAVDAMKKARSMLKQ
jgi:putative addiction module component (TIGR02574 family)